MTTTEKQVEQLSVEEQRIYDRQIRAWGLATQQRMRSANLLVIGRIGGLAAEICKNVVLAGVGGLTLCDNAPATIHTLSSNFLSTHELNVDNIQDTTLTEGQASLQALQALNSNVVVKHIQRPFDHPNTPTLNLSQAVDIKQYTCVIACGVSLRTAVALNQWCRADGDKERQFIYCDLDNITGLAFFDLNVGYEYWKLDGAKYARQAASQQSDYKPQGEICQQPFKTLFEVLYFAMYHQFPTSDLSDMALDGSKVVAAYDELVKDKVLSSEGADNGKYGETSLINSSKDIFNQMYPQTSNFFNVRADAKRTIYVAYVLRHILYREALGYNIAPPKDEQILQYLTKNIIPPNPTRSYPTMLSQNYPISCRAAEQINIPMLAGMNEKLKNNQTTTNITEYNIDTLQLTLGLEFSPYCAILGGIIGQEILRTFNKDATTAQPPLITNCNFLVFDAENGTGKAYDARLAL